MAAKNKDVDDLNFVIHNEIISTLPLFKNIDFGTNEDEATNYPIELFKSLDVPNLPPHNLRLKGWLSSNHALKPKPINTM